MTVEIRDPRMGDVIAGDAELRRVATGFLFTEGPLWHPRAHFLLFSDMPGNIIRRYDEAGGVRPFRQPSEMANGLAYDGEGRLVACQHATSSLTRTEPDGTITTLATHYRGKELNSPNDVIVGRDGAIYFSDPTYGRAEFYGVPREPELDFRGVYRLAPEGGEPELLVDDFAQPNGLCLSDDESLLFINDTERQHIRVFDRGPHGRLSNGRVFAETVGEGDGGPDGMKLDSTGRLFCCGPGGVHVFDGDGTCLGVIRIPEATANFAWGGSDLRTLFVTASTSLYAVELRHPGRPAF